MAEFQTSRLKLTLGWGLCSHVGGKTLGKASCLGYNTELAQLADQRWLVDGWFISQRMLLSSLIHYICPYKKRKGSLMCSLLI